MYEKVLKTVFDAVEEVNKQLPCERRLDKTTDAVIFGKTGRLDSLGFVTLIVAIEQKIEEAYGTTINLTDEKAMSSEISPFETIGTLVDYVSSILKEKTGEYKRV